MSSRILVAVIPSARERLVRTLHDEETVVVDTFAQAAALLRAERFRLIIAGLYFDDSRMFELLPLARTSPLNATTRILCIRGVPGRLTPGTVQGIAQTVRTLGCEWLDVAVIADDATGQAFLRGALKALLADPGPKPLPESGSDLTV